MKILITGGAGYVGFTLAQKLAELPQVSSILIYDNLSRHNENILFGKFSGAEKLKLVRADILDSRKLKKNIQSIDVVFHLAAKVITPFANQDPHFFEQINNWGTAELVYAIETSEVRQLIYLSSASVYGKTQDAATEDSIPNPQTYYGISKLRGEEHVRRILQSKNTIIIRGGNVYGFSEAMRFDAVINNFMLQANFENKISIHGTGEQMRAFIHVDDLASILSKIPFTEIPSGVYNCIGKNLAVNDIAEEITQLYPTCDRIFMNQHITLGGIKVSTESKLSNYLKLPQRKLSDELKEFKSKFLFHY